MFRYFFLLGWLDMTQVDLTTVMSSQTMSIHHTLSMFSISFARPLSCNNSILQHDPWEYL